MEYDVGEFHGFMLIHNIYLSSKAPALRGEENFLDLILGKLEKAVGIAQESGLVPVLCGTFAAKTLDVELFKRLFPVLSQYPDIVILASGNMLDKKSGQVKKGTILDLIKTMNLCEVLAPADEQFIDAFVDSGVLRLSVGEKGSFAVTHVDDQDQHSRLVGSDPDLPVITRLTHEQAKRPAQVTVITGEKIEFLDIDTRPPIYMDTRFDVNRADEDFSSELVTHLQTLFNRTQEEQPDVEVNEQLKVIFKEQNTSEAAKRIALQIQKEVDDAV